MPTFPTYHGELPECLSPRKLRHYLLLAYWVYFRPTALKCYLYRADPELYRAGSGLAIFRTWRVPAYRNLYLMMPGVSLILSALVGLPIVLAASWLQGAPVNWPGWLAGVTFGVAVGVAVGMAVGVVIGEAFAVATSVAFDVAVGVAFGVAVGLVYGVMPRVVGDVAFGVMGGVAIDVAFGVAVGVAAGVAVGAAVGAVSVAAGAIGVAASAIGATIGAVRLIFYLPQLVLALWPGGRGTHPVAWDELGVLPWPNTRPALARLLGQDEAGGLRQLAQAASNPFQRWAVQSALSGYLHRRPAPLRFLYNMVADAALEAYVFAPTRRTDWKYVPSARQLLLGELAGEWVDCGQPLDRIVWVLTRPLRDLRRTPLARLAGLLYRCLDQEHVESAAFDLAGQCGIYAAVQDYPGGEEIACTFDAMADFLVYDDLGDLPAATSVASGLVPDAHSTRPAVLSTLARLGEVGAEVAAYRATTSRASRLAALARAADALNSLDDYVKTEVVAPERYILGRIVRQWQQLIIAAGGRVGRAEEVGPVANPYVAGNPVGGDLFVGRDDILRRLEELWGGPGQSPSVVLFGHRRMGKTSILHNLGARFGAQTVVVDFNMQRVGLVASSGELLYNLALALCDSLPAAETQGLEPRETAFTAHNPTTAFDRFLKQLDRARAGRRFIVAVDEFELIEQMVAEGKLEAHLLDFWRGLIQTYPWFIMAFAGLHTLQEMTRDYWHPLYGSVTGIPVSFLSHDAAWRLITQPTPDFAMDYDADAVERIIALTNGQPYLVQLAGHGLVTRFNRQTFEEGIERERRFGLADIEAVIGAPEFYRDGDAYFTGVWRQAETSPPPGQAAVLRALAPSEVGLPVEDIARQAGLSAQAVRDALEMLKRHDVVAQTDGCWRFTVELMRRWVAQKEG